jgi:hypothetical protein
MGYTHASELLVFDPLFLVLGEDILRFGHLEYLRRWECGGVVFIVNFFIFAVLWL